jgi:hypothetical protein
MGYRRGRRGDSPIDFIKFKQATTNRLFSPHLKINTVIPNEVRDLLLARAECIVD